MSTPQENALNSYKQYKVGRRRKIEGKHQEGYYVTGDPIVQGKTKAQLKKEQKEAWKNRHNDPNYKGLGSSYMNK